MDRDAPFPVNVPAEQGDVVDRQAFIDQLVTRLLDGESIVLAAPRRLGKTSVAHEVLRRIRDDEHACTAALDIAAVASLRELAERLTAACLGAVEPAARAAMKVWRGLARLAQIPEVRARMHDLELSLALRPEKERRPEDLLQEALDLPQHLAEYRQTRFVVLFDEFQAAAAVGGRSLLARMRGTFQLQSKAAYLFLGSQSGVMRQLFAARNQPFFRFATLLELPPVPEEAWRAYIGQRLRDHRLDVDEAALDAILEYTGGHPADTMRVAYSAYLLARGRHRLNAPLAMAACAEAQTQLRPVFDAELDAGGPRAGTLLARIAKNEALYEGARSNATVQRALRALETNGFIRHVAPGRYVFVEPMLARHLRREAW